MRIAYPYWQFGLLSFGSAIMLTAGISSVLHPLLAWLVAINVVTVAAYRYDKIIASSMRTRVPERVLLSLAVVGGTIGAAFAMWVLRPRHKTRSVGFLVWFFLILLVQVAGVAGAFYAGNAFGK